MLLTVFITEALSVGNGFGGGSGPILLVDVLCVGTEQRLLDCPQSFPVGSGVSECSHTMDAGVACQPQIFEGIVHADNWSILQYKLWR